MQTRGSYVGDGGCLARPVFYISKDIFIFQSICNYKRKISEHNIALWQIKHWMRGQRTKLCFSLSNRVWANVYLLCQVFLSKIKGLEITYTISSFFKNPLFLCSGSCLAIPSNSSKHVWGFLLYRYIVFTSLWRLGRDYHLYFTEGEIAFST